jgi:hypothetical protein
VPFEIPIQQKVYYGVVTEPPCGLNVSLATREPTVRCAAPIEKRS